MVSVLNLLLLILCAGTAYSSPVRRYSNSTSIHQHSTSDHIHETANIAASPNDAPPTSTLSAIAGYSHSTQAVGGAAATMSSDSCESSMAAAPAYPTTAHKAIANATMPIYGATVRPKGRYGDQNSHERPSGTTTLTLLTTVPPYGQASSSYAISSQSSELQGSYGSSSAFPSSSIVASSTYAATTMSSRHRKLSSSPAVRGSVTWTYEASSQASMTPSSTLSSRSTKMRTTKHPKHTKALPTSKATSSNFGYPYPQSSKTSRKGVSSATANPALSSLVVYTSPTYSYAPPDSSTSRISSSPATSSVASSPASYSPSSSSKSIVASSPAPYSSPPHYGPSASLPPIVSYSPFAPSSTELPASSSSTTTGPGGITIVPVNPDATTIYVTVTTTDAGVTTTVARQTVTADSYW